MAPIHTTSTIDNTLAPSALQLSSRALMLALIMSTPVIAQTAKDTVRWDDRAGQWVYTLFNPGDQSRYKEVRYTPRTLIEPTVKSKVQGDKDLYEYRYRVKNGASARLSINSISVRAPTWDISVPQRPEPIAGETHSQALARVRSANLVMDQFVAKTLYSPNRWGPFLNVNRPTRVVFGWLVDSQQGYAGIAPRSAEDSFSVLRTELPGAGWMELQGDTPDMYNAPTLPRSGAVADQVADVLANDAVYVPVLLPAIVLPKPYNGAELARRLKAHVATWLDAGLMDADSLAAVNPKLDILISALSAKDKKAARAAIQALMAEARKHHPGMGDSHIDDDEDAHDAKSDRRKVISDRGSLTDVIEPGRPIHRVAVRALVFDLRYLLERMESGR